LHFIQRYPNTQDILRRKPELRAKLVKEWDTVKREFSDDMGIDHVLEIPSALTEYSEVLVVFMLGGSSIDIIGIRFRFNFLGTTNLLIKENWEMSAAILRSVFEPVVQKILLCLTAHLDKACMTEKYSKSSSRKILLAGGFGNSGYLAFRLNHFAEMNELGLIRTAVAQCMVSWGYP
jgi:hypothetical protein